MALMGCWPEQDDALVPDAVFAPRGVIRPHTEYQTDPVGWAVDKLGIPEHTIRWHLNAGYNTHQWDGDMDPIAAAMEAIRDWKDAAVESATGTGKSFGAAVLILWFLGCFENAQVFTFALNADQLKLYIWKNITELWPRFQAWFPHAELTSLCIRMRGGIDETWAAHGRPVQIRTGETVASRAQGMHAEHMLLVYEEAAAMEWAIIEAGRNTCTGPHNLRLFIGNPNHQLDSLHRVSEQPGVVALRVSALDHPNVVTGNANLIPGACSHAANEKRRLEYGESDPVYLSRVRGISPEQAANSLIRVEWLRRAAERWSARKAAGTMPALVTGKGVDVANSEHGDSAAICDFAGNAVVRLDAFPCNDSNRLGAQIVTEARRHGLLGARVGVDAIGVGAGTVNEARRLGFMLQALYAGGSPMQMVEKAEDGQRVEWSPDVNQFKNLRGQMYWQMREDLRTDQIDAPEDREWWAELTAHTFEDHDKVTLILPKDDVKVLLGRSPDKADASVMANWVRARAVTPVAKTVRQGQSMGYDYQARKPRERVTADQEMHQTLQRAHPNLGASRYSIPNRRGR